MPSGITVKLDDEKKKRKYVEEVSRIQEEIKREQQKYDWIPIVSKSIPIASTIGLGIYAFKKGFFKKHQTEGPIITGIAAATLPVIINVFGEIGKSIADKKKSEVEAKYRRELLRSSLKLKDADLSYSDSGITIK